MPGDVDPCKFLMCIIVDWWLHFVAVGWPTPSFVSAALLLQWKLQPAQSHSALWDRLEISSYTTTSIESGALSFHIKLNGTETDFSIADNGTRNTHVKLDLSENVYPSLLGMSLILKLNFQGASSILKKQLTVARVWTMAVKVLLTWCCIGGSLSHLSLLWRLS